MIKRKKYPDLLLLLKKPIAAVSISTTLTNSSSAVTLCRRSRLAQQAADCLSASEKMSEQDEF